MIRRAKPEDAEFIAALLEHEEVQPFLPAYVASFSRPSIEVPGIVAAGPTRRGGARLVRERPHIVRDEYLWVRRAPRLRQLAERASPFLLRRR